MSQKKFHTRLDRVMQLLGLNDLRLAQISGVDHSLISKWHKCVRPLTRRSKQIYPVAQALLDADKDGALEALIAPYAHRSNAVEGLIDYLVSPELPGLAPQATMPTRQTSGDYVAQYRVFLGESGFRKATLAMLDYVMVLPPGQQLVIVCQGRYDLMLDNLPFVIQFIAKLRTAIKRGTRTLLVNREGFTSMDTAAFTPIWLAAHLRGYIRSRYYSGAPPENIRYLASIPGYWSARVEDDPEVEDGLYTAMYTDPRDTRRDQQLCDYYVAASKLESQYGFLRNPAGRDENIQLWRHGPLPAWPGAKKTALPPPDGSLYAICRVPGFGLMHMDEYRQVLGGDAPPDFPEYLFLDEDRLAPGPYRIILCREDVREGLVQERRQHEVLSALLHRRAFVPRSMLRRQLQRLLAAMEARDDVEVALVPRIAFRKLQIELVCFRGSVSVAWLQTMRESVFANDAATSGSFYNAISYIWGQLLAGWKRSDKTRRQLRKWLAGKDLAAQETDSAIVENWDITLQNKK